ncbi:MAG: hypothetical protein ACUVTQ_10675 [Desulfotomaculales bacterium]
MQRAVDTLCEPREWYLSEPLGKRIYDSEGRIKGIYLEIRPR